MSLSDRLKQAETHRKIAAGLLHSEAALKPEAVDAPAGSPLFEPVTIEVPPAGLHAVADAPSLYLDDDRRTQVCPNCRREGQVDMVDLVGQRVHLSCATCGTMWQVAREAATAAADAQI